MQRFQLHYAWKTTLFYSLLTTKVVANNKQIQANILKKKKLINIGVLCTYYK